jgi:hypothetical protein
MDNRDSARAGRGFGTASTAAMLLLENGENEISLEIGALGWFNKNIESATERAQFHPQAGCKLELTTIRGGQSAVISAIEVGIGEDGLPQAKMAKDEPKYHAISGPVMRQQVMAEQVVPGHMEAKYFNLYRYPAKMELYRFSRQVVISGLPQWPWVKATAYTGTPAQRQGLQQAYLQVWQALNNSDTKVFRQQLKHSLNAWAWATGETAESIFDDQAITSRMQAQGFKMIPINWADYEVRIMNKGRMVQLINKSDPSVSPLTYYYVKENGKTSMGILSPIFSLIDGEFVMVI